MKIIVFTILTYLIVDEELKTYHISYDKLTTKFYQL